MGPARTFFNARRANRLNPQITARTIRRRSIGHRRGGRVVECTGLENQQGFVALRGFESHPLRQNIKRPIRGVLYFCRGGLGHRSERNAVARQAREARGAAGTVPPCSTRAATKSHARTRSVYPTWQPRLENARATQISASMMLNSHTSFFEEFQECKTI